MLPISTGFMHSYFLLLFLFLTPKNEFSWSSLGDDIYELHASIWSPSIIVTGSTFKVHIESLFFIFFFIILNFKFLSLVLALFSVCYLIVLTN